MTNQPSTTGAKASPAHITQEQRDYREHVLNDISKKWDKFSRQELDAMKDNYDLVVQVIAKYGVEAQLDVDGVLKGRTIALSAV